MLLQNITKIPDEIETYDAYRSIDLNIHKLIEYIPEKIAVRCRTYYADDMTWMIKLAYYMDAINCIDNNARAILWYRKDCSRRFLAMATGADLLDNTIGLAINEEASTHYEEDEFEGLKRMPSLEKMLKQTPNHFLKIFTTEHNRVLYVWTNKRLTPATMYSLKRIQNKLDNEYLKHPKKYVEDFYKALHELNLEGVRKSLNDFMESDYVKNYSMRKFQECVTYYITSRIQNMENSLTNLRKDIVNYERAIMEAAGRIRETNETLEILRGKDQKENINILYKYLNKHPYIKEFEPQTNGMLTLYFVSPIIYFNEYALDKLIQNRSGDAKFILQTIKERKYTLWTRCAVGFHTGDFRAYIETSDRNLDYMPHPHIEMYGCFGNHNEAIAESSISGDYLGAIEQISQATLNLNFYDTCVVNGMIRAICDRYNDLKTWYVEETGELISLNEIKEREAK